MPYEYEDAGKNASEELKKLIEEFRGLPEEDKSEKPLLYHILQSGTPPYKMSKGDSKYTDETKIESQDCENCEFIYLKLANKKYICSQIRGRVQLGGWCKLWKSAKTS